MQGGKFAMADTLSPGHVEVPETQVWSFSINVLQDISDKTILEVIKSIQKDEGMQKVLGLIRNGWLDRKEKVPYEAMPFR